jgi:hypothetical protein
LGLAEGSLNSLFPIVVQKELSSLNSEPASVAVRWIAQLKRYGKDCPVSGGDAEGIFAQCMLENIKV